MGKLADYALSWVGKRFPTDDPRTPQDESAAREQCMNFVRHCLQAVNHPLRNAITSNPVDGIWTNYSLASSLAGRDLGQLLISLADLRPDDIIFFQNTYRDSSWPSTWIDPITHVAIVGGPNRMVHRPTAARPVEEVQISGYWETFFRCALDVKDAVEPKQPQEQVRDKTYRTLNASKHDGKTGLNIDQKPNQSLWSLSNDKLIVNGTARRLIAYSVQAWFE